jgi:hypothetical protein
LRRLVVLSFLLILGGLAILLPSSALYSLITTGSTTSGSAAVAAFGASRASTTDNTTTIESLLGFGLIGVGAVLELLSLFTDVGGAMPTETSAQAEMAPTMPSGPATSAVKVEKRKP